MCTAISYSTKEHFFGRNLDVRFSYQECITLTPRNFPLHFRQAKDLASHYALLGVSLVQDGIPLYYDAINEKGVGMAGLSFPQNAYYKPSASDRYNITPFELISWILGQCASVAEARKMLEYVNLAEENFSVELPLTPLHWMVSDCQESITVETLPDALAVYDNPVGVLTNNPTFPFQMLNLSNYINVTRDTPTNRFCSSLPLEPYSLGMGGLGLPGDLSSASRFVKAAFTKLNSICGGTESDSISQFFHILNSVAQQRGCVRVDKSEYEYTFYTSCCNLDRGIYYYTTYENQQISGVDMHRENLDGTQLIRYPLLTKQQIWMQN